MADSGRRINRIVAGHFTMRCIDRVRIGMPSNRKEYLRFREGIAASIRATRTGDDSKALLEAARREARVGKGLFGVLNKKVGRHAAGVEKITRSIPNPHVRHGKPGRDTSCCGTAVLACTCCAGGLLAESRKVVNCCQVWNWRHLLICNGLRR